jgi:hypothetical protein
MGESAETDVGNPEHPLDLDLFRKVWALTASNVEGEAEAARLSADRMAEAAGMFLSDAVREATPPEDRDNVYIPGPLRV